MWRGLCVKDKMDKLKTDRLVIVEGKYDKLRLENIIDGKIIAVGGFGIYKDKALRQTIKSLSQNGVIIVTDSDRAGYKIRVFLTELLEGRDVINVFVPQIAGVERRKSAPSAEGYLGVEGVPDSELRDCLERFCTGGSKREEITAADLYERGLCGCPGAAARKNALLEKLGVQHGLSNRFLLRILNERYTKSEFEDLKF